MSFPQNVILWYCTSRTSPYPVKTQRDSSDGGDLGSCQVSWSPNRLARPFGASCLHRHIQCEIETDFMGQSTHKYSWQLHNDADLIHLIHLQREASNTKLHFHCIHYIITYNHYNIHTHPLEIHIQQGRTALSAENGAFAAASSGLSQRTYRPQMSVRNVEFDQLLLNISTVLKSPLRDSNKPQPGQSNRSGWTIKSKATLLGKNL